MNEEGDGKKIYRMNEISNMMCNRNILKYAPINEEETKFYTLNDKDILFNRTNSQSFVGRTGIFRSFSNEPLVFASYLVRVVPDPDKITPEYLTAFLNTKYGIIDVKRRARISINQSNVNAEELKRIEVPLVSHSLQLQIAIAFENAFESIQKSEMKFKESQSILLAELGLNNWQPQHCLTFIRYYSETQAAARIDAEYFQPKYQEIVQAIKNYVGGWDMLGNLCGLVGHPTNPPYAQNDDDHKTFIVAQKNLGDYCLSDAYWQSEDAKYTTSEFMDKNKQYLLQKDDLVLYTVGAPPHIGKANIIFETDIPSTIGSFVTLVRAHKDKINPYCLLTLFNSPVGYQLTNRFMRGMVQQYIYPRDLIRIPIPLLPQAKQHQIQQKVIESFNLRQQSKQLLECAKRAVELAIEQDEQAAINWLQDQMHSINPATTTSV